VVGFRGEAETIALLAESDAATRNTFYFYGGGGGGPFFFPPPPPSAFGRVDDDALSTRGEWSCSRRETEDWPRGICQMSSPPHQV